MERYAPTAKDLASRDVVSRAMTIEIMEGRVIFLICNFIKNCLGCWRRKRPLLFTFRSLTP